MKASKIIELSCCVQGLPIDCNKWELAKKVEKLEKENEKYKRDDSEINFYFEGQLNFLKEKNKRLKTKCDFMFCIIVIFLMVIIYA